MLSRFMKARGQQTSLALGWDDEAFVIQLGDRLLLTAGWDSITTARVWRSPDTPRGCVELAIDLRSVGSLCLQGNEIGFDQFIRQCESRLRGWRRDWRSQLNEPDVQVVIWKQQE
ncbi:MAG: hypothetical protein KF902_02165 [Phycisphaeraceae bacterium]|nr:hypothetical protein [Phycisphaeraceae bacterium]